MIQYQIRFLIVISSVTLLLAGCGTAYPDLLVSGTNDPVHPLILPFSRPGIEAVYKAEIELFENYYSGLLAFSIDSASASNIVFINVTYIDLGRELKSVAGCRIIYDSFVQYSTTVNTLN